MPALAMNPDGSLALPMRQVRGVEVVRNRIRVRDQTLKGEWLTDTSLGFVDPDEMDSRGVSPQVAAAERRAQLEATTGVDEVISSLGRRDGDCLFVDVEITVTEDGETATISINLCAFGTEKT